MVKTWYVFPQKWMVINPLAGTYTCIERMPNTVWKIDDHIDIYILCFDPGTSFDVKCNNTIFPIQIYTYMYINNIEYPIISEYSHIPIVQVFPYMWFPNIWKYARYIEILI